MRVTNKYDTNKQQISVYYEHKTSHLLTYKSQGFYANCSNNFYQERPSVSENLTNRYCEFDHRGNLQFLEFDVSDFRCVCKIFWPYLLLCSRMLLILRQANQNSSNFPLVIGRHKVSKRLKFPKIILDNVFMISRSFLQLVWIHRLYR